MQNAKRKTQKQSLSAIASSRFRRSFCVLTFAFCVLLLVAASDPTDLVRQGNEALADGRSDAAHKLYRAAEERADDPGLVAFNEGVAFASQGEFREGELRFQRVLEDRDASPSRRSKAFYNRGVCLLQRGTDATAYRTAIECFERCLELSDDVAIESDAKHNLELAKILWGRARTKEKTPPKASDPPPESQPEQPERVTRSDPRSQGDGSGTNSGSRAQPIGPQANRGQNPLSTDQKAPGAGNLPVRLDKENPQPLSPDDARRDLQQIAERLQKDRRANLALLARPEFPNVRDW